MRVLIVGAGGHGQVVADIVREMHVAGGPERVVGYFDDRRHSEGAEIAGIPVLGTMAEVRRLGSDALIVAVGDNRTRQRLTRELSSDGSFATAIHPSAVVSADARIGSGSMLCAGVIVNTGTVVGSGVILNTGCSVDHHSDVRDFVHIGPGVRMGGEVRVGEGAFIGIGATVLPRIVIGAWSVVGAGAVVTRDVPPGVTVVGCPAKPIRDSAAKAT